MRSCRKRLQTGHSRSGSMIGVFSLRQRRYLKICLFPAAPTDYFRSLSLPPPSVFQIIQGSCNHSRRQEPINNDNAAMISRIRQVLVHLGFYGLQHTHKHTHTHAPDNQWGDENLTDSFSPAQRHWQSNFHHQTGVSCSWSHAREHRDKGFGLIQFGENSFEIARCWNRTHFTQVFWDYLPGELNQFQLCVLTWCVHVTYY